MRASEQRAASPQGLISVKDRIAEMLAARRERMAHARTGVACPDCKKELQRAIPPITTTGGDCTWAFTSCRQCGKQVWLPEN